VKKRKEEKVKSRNGVGEREKDDDRDRENGADNRSWERDWESTGR